jgi:hypothetical protein
VWGCARARRAGGARGPGGGGGQARGQACEQARGQARGQADQVPPEGELDVPRTHIFFRICKENMSGANKPGARGEYFVKVRDKEKSESSDSRSSSAGRKSLSARSPRSGDLLQPDLLDLDLLEPLDQVGNTNS